MYLNYSKDRPHTQAADARLRGESFWGYFCPVFHPIWIHVPPFSPPIASSRAKRSARKSGLRIFAFPVFAGRDLMCLETGTASGFLPESYYSQIKQAISAKRRRGLWTEPGNSHRRAPSVAPCDSRRSARLLRPLGAPGSGPQARGLGDEIPLRSPIAKQ